MKIEIVSCLLDNYAYILVDDARTASIIIDPSEPRPMLEAISASGVEPIAVLCTHHHNDHIGGLPAIIGRFPSIQVFGHPHDRDRIAGFTDAAGHEQKIQLGPFNITALHVPGHTLGAVTWLIEKCAFTGDTMFVGGCGKLFEGTAEQMYLSLNEVLAPLGDDTLIYCGHEYTSSNLRFALRIEPDNQLAKKKLEDALIRRFTGDPTVPSTLSEERQTNPFLRCKTQPVLETARREGCKSLDPVSVFGWLRNRKDHFRPSEVGRPAVKPR